MAIATDPEDTSAPSPLWQRIPRLVGREAYISWRFIWRDMSTTMIPAFIFGIAAAKSMWPMSASAAILAVGRNLFYFWLYIYAFALVNQITGLEEDKIDKPDRPLPSGLVSIRGAETRWVATITAFVVVGYSFGVIVWTLLWAVVVVLLAFGNFDKHWFTKNPIAMSLGTLAQLAAAWQMVTPISSIAWRWIVVVSIFAGMPTCVQDFRDVNGDRTQGRRTLPIALGDNRARNVMACVFIGVPVLLHFGLLAPVHSTRAILFDAVFVAMSVAIAIRIRRYQTPAADHKTYMLFTYLYCVILAAAVILI